MFNITGMFNGGYQIIQHNMKWNDQDNTYYNSPLTFIMRMDRQDILVHMNNVRLSNNQSILMKNAFHSPLHFHE